MIFFKILNEYNDNDEHDENFNIHEPCNPICDEILNGIISETEIKDAIKELKNNKAPGTDMILNEFLKSSLPSVVSIYCKLFNLVLDTGIIPENWTCGIIKPVYKNKGDPSNPDNYRAITLLSCLGKLFTSILNTRLNFFANEFKIISENQTGFRKGYSTTDNIFVLHALIEIYFSFNKKNSFVPLWISAKLSTRYGDLVYGRNYINMILRVSVSKLFITCIMILSLVLNIMVRYLNFIHV